jgi:hypothetical protein
MQHEETLTITFEEVATAEANRYAEDLRSNILRADPLAKVDRSRQDATSMDFGTTLVLVLGAPSVVATARAISNWLKRNNAAMLRLETKDGRLLARNLKSEDASAIINSLFKHQQR